MKIAGSQTADAAVRLFNEKWRQRKPFAQAPQLHPPRPADPEWVLANELWMEAWEEARRSLDEPRVAELYTDNWTIGAGFILCPDNHASTPGDTYCSGCGREIPPHLKHQASDELHRLNNKVLAGWSRLGF